MWSVLRKPLLRAASPSVQKGEFRERGSNPVAGDSSTPSTSAKLDAFDDASAEPKIDPSESNPKDLSQPDTSGVKEGEINLRPQTGKSKDNTDEIQVSPMQIYQKTWEKLITRIGINPTRCLAD